MNIKKIILDTVADQAIDFILYDRREDEELSCEALDKALKDGTITTEEIAKEFKAALDRYLED